MRGRSGGGDYCQLGTATSSAVAIVSAASKLQLRLQLCSHAAVLQPHTNIPPVRQAAAATLLRAGADAAHADHLGSTPLHLAAEGGGVALLRMLIDSKRPPARRALLSVVDAAGRDAAARADAGGHGEAAAFLRSHVVSLSSAGMTEMAEVAEAAALSPPADWADHVADQGDATANESPSAEPAVRPSAAEPPAAEPSAAEPSAADPPRDPHQSASSSECEIESISAAELSPELFLQAPPTLFTLDMRYMREARHNRSTRCTRYARSALVICVT